MMFLPLVVVDAMWGMWRCYEKESQRSYEECAVLVQKILAGAMKEH
jgi:hypothetical protein